MKEKTIVVKLNNAQYRLERLDDDRYDELSRKSLCIADDYRFSIGFFQYEQLRGEALSLGQVYIALKELTGESSKLFDDWKCAFSFPFALEIERDSNTYHYLLRIVDYRGSLEFNISRQVKPHESYDKNVIHQSFAEEFSGDEINEFNAYIYNYIKVFFKVYIKVVQPHDMEEFFKNIDSNLIVYGYKDGFFFEDHYNDYDEYHEALSKLRARDRI